MNIQTLHQLLHAPTPHELLQQQQKTFIPDMPLWNENKKTPPQLPNELFFKNKDIYISKHSRYAPYPEHSHQFLELNYVFSGTCTQRINQVDYTFKKGDLLLLDVGSTHSIQALSEEDIVLNILFQNSHISIEWLAQQQGRNSLLYQLLLSRSIHKSIQENFIIFNNLEGTHAGHIIHQMLQEYFIPNDFSSSIISSYLPILFYELARSLPVAHEKAFMSAKEEPFLRILDLIDTDYSHLSLQSAAHQLNFNKNYLSNLVKEKSGQTFTELLNQKKVMKAQLLIQSTALPIHEIAHLVGFTNSTYFYKQYQRILGHTPSHDRSSAHK